MHVIVGRSATLLFALLILSGHTLSGTLGRDDDCAAMHSRAWCVLSLFGAVQGLKDDLVDRTSPAASRVMNGVGVGLGAGQIAGKVSGPPGVNAGAFGALTILSAMTGPPGGRLRAMAFASIADGAADADDETLRQALISTIGKAAVLAMKGESFSIEAEQKDPPLGKSYTSQYIRVRGGDCSNSICELRSWWFRSNLPLKRIDAPAWIGGGRVAGWMAAGGKFVPTMTIDGRVQPMKVLMDLMEQLRGHFYLYVPAGELEEAPVLVHGSDRLRFVSPTSVADPRSTDEAGSPASDSVHPSVPVTQ